MAALPACREKPPGQIGEASSAADLTRALDAAGVTLRDWTFPEAASMGGPERAVILVPRASTDGQRFPVLVALPGRGEALRGAEVSAYAWVKTYKLLAIFAALARGRLVEGDLGSMVEPSRLEAMNQSLAAAPFGGVILVCPHVPDLTGARNLAPTERWGQSLLEHVLPRVRRECPVSDAVGIDGVSMGGRVAMLVGLANPGDFASVSGIQPAFQASEAASLTERARAYLAARPGGKIRLLTSDRDHFRAAVGEIDGVMRRAGVAHEHRLVVGPHDYSFNEGPGGAELLLWHERVLRGLPPP